MSCNSPWPMPDFCPARRRWLLAALAWPLSVHAARADAPWQGLRRWGSGEYRWLGLPIYEATLWAGEDPQRPPLVLRLDYRWAIEGAQIAAASAREMRRLGGEERQIALWETRMREIFPSVKSGDSLLGEYRNGRVRFYFNARLLAEIDDGDFAEQFFAIWLHPRTSAPALRTALLGRQAN